MIITSSFSYLPLTADKVKVAYDERVNTTDNSDGVKHSILMISKLKIKTDRGDYTCTASNHLGSDEKVVTLKVKGTRDSECLLSK